MALTYSRQIFSGSSNGLPIEVSAVSSPGTTIHTVGATATSAREEIILYMTNGATVDQPVTVELGGTSTKDHIKATIPSRQGLQLMVPGISLTATSSIVRAFSTGTATETLRACGWVNRAT